MCEEASSLGTVLRLCGNRHTSIVSELSGGHAKCGKSYVAAAPSYGGGEKGVRLCTVLVRRGRWGQQTEPWTDGGDGGLNTSSSSEILCFTV